MCKVLIIPSIKPHVRKKAVLFMKAMAKEMSYANKDGLGYAAIDDEGNLFGERWLNNEDFFNGESFKSERTVDKYLGKLIAPATTTWSPTKTPGPYSKFGEGSIENAVAVTLHARMATSAKGHQNTHPFVDDDVSVIHNGVIRNSDEFKLQLSTCDSEALLISYLRNEVAKDIKNVAALAKEVEGYYVAASFARDEYGNRILDVYKSNNDNLHASWIPELETYVLTTSEFNIRDACKTLGWSYEEAAKLQDHIAVRINPYTGDVIADTKFTASAIGYKQNYTWQQNYPTAAPAATTPASNVTRFPNKKSKNYTPGLISYMQKTPKIEIVTEREVEEELQFLSGGWRN